MASPLLCNPVLKLRLFAFTLSPCVVSALASAILGGVLGCASTGPPRPPSLHLPQPVRDLSAQRFGSYVGLRFTVPTLSTDKEPLTRKHGAGNLSAQLCRIDTTSAGPCVPVQTRDVASGQSISMRDTLPPALLTGPARLIRYRVRLLNVQGRSAPDTRDAQAIAGAAPPPLLALTATTTACGIQLTWQRQPVTSGTGIVLTTEPTSRTLTLDGDPGGAVDPTPKAGDSITYTVVRTRTVSAAQLGSPLPLGISGDPATITVARSPDTFPPATPAGLVAVAVQLQNAAPEIELSWQPNTEPDLAGYLIERNPSASAPLTPIPITTLSFRDTTVQLGQTYSYTLRAVDAVGNRSPASAAATETVRP